ncbi:MAG: hypothetical protein H7338_19225 [Candidatus Sericytochromatia bacterium]|nr:hypothetical protein [Candidatus Sericytochromatia bacterium]
MSDLITYEPGGPQALDNLPPIHPGEILAPETIVTCWRTGAKADQRWSCGR